MNDCIAVFDVGKTNKKLLIFDENLEILETTAEHFPADESGPVHFERIEEMSEWFLDRLGDFASRYPIRAVSVATQGATWLCVGADGGLTVPPVAYTTEPGDEFHAEFYDRFGGVEKIQRTTGTAPMSNLLNGGQLMMFLNREYPKEFAAASAILGMPQYFGFLLTGKTGAEPTYTGSHSNLLDYETGAWSFIAEDLGLTDKLPQGLDRTWDILGTVSPEIARRTGLAEDTVVTMGMHDSNASLLPYLLKEEGDFILDSTGTWCACMRPSPAVSFTRDEIGKLVYFNLDVRSRPVKTTILLGGLEFETWSKIIKEINGEKDFPPFVPESYERAVEEGKRFIFPGVVRGTGQFPDSMPRVYDEGKWYSLEDVRGGKIPDFFRDYTVAFAVLNLSLAIQTKVALERVGIEGGTPVYIEGGFQNNPDYGTLLTALYPESKVYHSSLKEATAFGAALLGKAALDGVEPEDLSGLYEIEKIPVIALRLERLDAYIGEFLRLL
ncbi:MAG: FGGY-family carbohydrate kinase [Spirochaetia bacterium]